MTKVAVIGAGSWGTAVACVVAANAEVTLWARREDLTDAIRRHRRNLDYLPDVELPDSISVTSRIEEACSQAGAVVVGVPSHGFRAVVEQAAPHIGSEVPVISLSKGVEQSSLLRMTEVVAELLASHSRDRIGVLTGPNLAKEVAAGQPAAGVVALPDEQTAEWLQALFSSPTFRVYTNPDVVGCEIAGALKNVIAIGSGIAAGLGYGDNTRAALMTRGLAELARLGVALGGDPLTFAGLAGMGDLIATCSSTQSRNRHVGYELGRGRSLNEIVDEMRMVAEGVKTTRAVLEIADRERVEMPLSAFVGRVLYEGARPADLVPDLMLRKAKSEMHGIR